MSLIVIAAPDKTTNHPIFVRTERPKPTQVVQKSRPRPKCWGFTNQGIILGVGPNKAYRRLIGTQYGLVFRSDDGPVIIAIANTYHGVVLLRDQVSRKIHPAQRKQLGIIQNEKYVPMPIPHIAKRHHHKAKRRKSLANRHLNWWLKTPGFPRNLEPPEVTTIDLVIEETRQICNGTPPRKIPVRS